MRNKALLVIDMQKDLCYDKRRKEKVINFLPYLIETIEMFERFNYPIYYLCFALQQDDKQFEKYGDQYCIEGTEGAEIIPELLPVKGSVIYKSKHSAFFETNLDDSLRKENVEEIFLTGMQTQICILTTAADASFRGYRTVAISDCVLSTRENKKKWALNWIKKNVGEVLTVSELVQEFKHEK